MTNIDAGSQRIRRLPDKPIVGETYPNAGGIYKVDRYDAERDLAWVHRPKDGWKCCAHGPALYDVPGRGINVMSECLGAVCPIHIKARCLIRVIRPAFVGSGDDFLVVFIDNSPQIFELRGEHIVHNLFQDFFCERARLIM